MADSYVVQTADQKAVQLEPSRADWKVDRRAGYLVDR